MISRKSAKLIAEAYESAFTRYSLSTRNYARSSTYKYEFKREQLYDFLYENEYEAWFLNLIKGLRVFEQREFKEFMMKVHTGESALAATKDWTWEARRMLGQRYLKDLAEDIIKMYENTAPSEFNAKSKVDAMKAQLELDGYIYKNGVLYHSESSVIEESEEQSYLENLVDTVALPDTQTIKHHISLAEEHYVNSKWDDSIANSRKFLEAILSQVAHAFNLKKYNADINTKTLERPVEVRDYLEREKLIETKEKEAVGKIYGLLSGTGSHPYIAEKDQARLMWHLALTFSQFVLLRYEGYLKNNP